MLNALLYYRKLKNSLTAHWVGSFCFTIKVDSEEKRNLYYIIFCIIFIFISSNDVNYYSMIFMFCRRKFYSLTLKNTDNQALSSLWLFNLFFIKQVQLKCISTRIRIYINVFRAGTKLINFITLRIIQVLEKP